MEDPGSRLCLSCGLCCNGTLFEFATAAPEERVHIEAVGLDYVEEESRTGFRQPCPAFCGRCGIYDERPRVCQTFRCTLLRAVTQGEVPFDEAQKTIATAKELVRRGDALGVDLSTSSGRKAVREAGPAAAPQAYLQAMAIGTFFERHFKKAGKPAAKNGDQRSA